MPFKSIQKCSFVDLSLPNYSFNVNADRFNVDMKSSSNGKYIESSEYLCKKESGRWNDNYRAKQSEVASAAFNQESLTTGSINVRKTLHLSTRSLLAATIVKDNLPFEYLIWGAQMRKNIDHELQLARKQKEVDYKPFHDPTSFKYELRRSFFSLNNLSFAEFRMNTVRKYKTGSRTIFDSASMGKSRDRNAYSWSDQLSMVSRYSNAFEPCLH